MKNKKRNKILRKSHDIVKILNECRKYEVFREIEISRDFLEHINNNFQRYPSQMYEIARAQPADLNFKNGAKNLMLLSNINS